MKSRSRSSKTRSRKTFSKDCYDDPIHPDLVGRIFTSKITWDTRRGYDLKANETFLVLEQKPSTGRFGKYEIRVLSLDRNVELDVLIPFNLGTGKHTESVFKWLEEL